MENAIKLAEATAWPIAVVIVAVVALVIVKMLLAKSGKFSLKVKDIVGFEADASRQIATGPEEAPAALERPVVSPSDAVIDAPSEARTELSPVAPSTEEENPESDRSAFARLWDATSLHELEAAFEDFKAEESPIEMDFWSGFYIDRRQRLGAPGTAEEFRSLADANPTWITPLTYLLRRAVDAHDLQGAEALISQLLARRTKHNSENVLRSIIQAYAQIFGAARAVEFYQEQLKNGLSSGDQAAMLDSLATNVKANDVFGYRIASEMAALVEPAGRNHRFDLAYSYGDENRTWALSFANYQGIDKSKDNYIASVNNLGVHLRGLDDKASLELYDKASQEGDAQSSSNLARILIDDGFISAGERLLDGITGSVGSAEEHIAASRAAALAARRSLSRRMKDITEFVSAEANHFKSAVARALRVFNEGMPIRRGLYLADDASFMVLVDAAGAGCQLQIGALQYQGVLPPSIMGFDGTLQYPGATILSGGLSVSLLATSGEGLTAIIWPASKALNARIRYVELAYTERQQSLNAPTSSEEGNA